MSPKINKRTKIAIGILMIASVLIALIVLLNFALIKYTWIHVHLIPHSHDDVGWLRTPEEYYQNYVKYILNHVIFELQQNPTRRFVYSETYFFWNWWQEQTDEVRALVRCLVERKQLEIVGGGWCMSDEAVTHYQSFIDQSTWGFRRLNDSLGPVACPTAAWQIDTFGHSKGIASLLAQMGFNSLFFARIDLNERKYRRSHKLMEFIWTGNKNLGDSGTIFTSVFYDHYSAPKGFDFEMQSSETFIKYDVFAQYVRRQAQYYNTANVLVPMGDDFRYFNARKYFQKIDSLIKFFRNNPTYRLSVFYSTPSLYIEKLRDCDMSWPVKEGDFFPYASEPHAYWTGFYTSRPTLKYFERIGNNLLQIAKQLLVFSKTGMVFFNELTSLREAVGVLQHHDAITGTSQQVVTDHYSELLYRGIENCEVPLDQALKLLSVSDANFQAPIYKSCLLLNISVCDVTERSSRFVVTVYNPLSRRIDHYVRVPVTGRCYSVLSADGTPITTQTVVIPESVRSIPGRKGNAAVELVFRATDVPAMGFKSFYVYRMECNGFHKVKRCCFRKKLKALFSRDTKLFSGVKTKKGNVTMSQTFRYYKSTPQLSGAYLFNPAGNVAYSFEERTSTRLLNNGILVREHEQRFSEWVSQIVRVYAEEDYVEFEWLVGPIPVDDMQGKEVVVIYNSTIKSGKIFYTDVNGMEMEKRVRDYQSWRNKILEKISSNYYPVTTMISLKDDIGQLFVVVDRPQGGSSLRSGELELMVHRRLTHDDGKGVEEPLNETAYGEGLVVRGRHWVLLGERGIKFEQQAKLFSQLKHSEPWLFFFDAGAMSFDEWRRLYLTEFSGLYSYVPRNVRILTLEPWRENTILVRFEHVLEKVPGLRLSNTPEDINLKDLFKHFDVVEARETTLGADRWLSDYQRPKWRKHTYRLRENKESKHIPQGNMTISLRPQEIRTFILTIRVLASRTEPTEQTSPNGSEIHSTPALQTKNRSGDRLGVVKKSSACKAIQLVKSKAKGDPKHQYQQKAENLIGDKLEDCVYCGETFPHKLLIKHKAEEEKGLKCHYCDKLFESVQRYRKHTYRYHKYYACKKCGLQFLKGAYEYHMSSVHRDKQECKTCNKTFATKLGLVAHQKKIHLGQREKRFCCEICKYEAPDKFQYKLHLARHNKTPSLMCDYCGDGHYTKRELDKHIQVDHHGGYRCEICSKSYRSSEYLKRHKATHEPDYDPSKVNFTCEECGKGFFNASGLKKHSLYHKDQLPAFTCLLCDKTLTSKATFDAHFRKHTCPDCGEAFTEKKQLVGHMCPEEENKN